MNLSDPMECTAEELTIMREWNKIGVLKSIKRAIWGAAVLLSATTLLSTWLLVGAWMTPISDATPTVYDPFGASGFTEVSSHVHARPI